MANVAASRCRLPVVFRLLFGQAPAEQTPPHGGKGTAMRRSRRALIIVLLAALAFATFAATAAPQTYRLRLHQGKGDKAVYTVAVVETDMLAGPEASERRIVTGAHLAWAVTFQGVSPDGTIRVESTIEGGPTKTEMGAQSKTGRVDDSVVNYVLTPRAEVKEAELASGSLPVISPLGTALSADDVFVPALLPDTPVKVGDRWQEALQVPAPTGDPGHARQVNQQSEVLGQVSYAGRSCLRIRTTLRQSQQLTQEAPDGSGTVAIKAQGESTVVWLFDPRQGLVMKVDSDGVDTAAHMLKAAGRGQQAVTIRKTVSIRSRMTEYNGKKIAAQ
jgi:hypothetical protein